MKRIVIINNLWSPYSNARYNAINKNKNIDLHIIFQTKKDKYRKWSEKDFDAKYKLHFLKNKTIAINKQDSFSLIIPKNLKKTLTEIKPERIICVGWDSPSTLIALRYAKKKKITTTIWSGSTENEKTLIRTITKPYVKWIIKQFDSAITYGTKATEYLRELGFKKKIYPFYNSIDNDFFEKESKLSKKEEKEMRAKLRISEDNKVILYVGSLIERKGPDILLEALQKSKIEKTTLLIVGEGHLKDKLKCMANKNNNIIFAGNIAPKKIPKYYGLADLFVLPSRREVWGLVVNEAMASGCAVIATDKCGSSYDLIKDNGIMIQSKNIEELKKAIEKIILDEYKLKIMKKRSKEIISEFTNEKTIKHIPIFL